MIVNPKDLPIDDPGFKVTEEAILHIENTIKGANETEVIGIRIGVKKAGCSGNEYLVEFAQNSDISAVDFVFDCEKFKVIIDKEVYIKFFKGGTTLDFVKQGFNEGLEFYNPNVKSQCGCGESFALVKE